MYRILFTHRSLRDFEKMDKKIQEKIADKLKEYAGEPLKYARKLVHPKIGTYRFRIEDYRVIFDIDNDNLVILRIGHRRSIYR